MVFAAHEVHMPFMAQLKNPKKVENCVQHAVRTLEIAPDFCIEIVFCELKAYCDAWIHDPECLRIEAVGRNGAIMNYSLAHRTAFSKKSAQLNRCVFHAVTKPSALRVAKIRQKFGCVRGQSKPQAPVAFGQLLGYK